MSFKFSDILKYAEFLPYIDDIAAVVKDATDGDSSKDKAADVIEDLVDLAIPLVAAKNPALGALIKEAQAEVHKALDPWKDQPATPPAA